MSDAIITALIMALGSIICQLLINRNNRKKRSVEETEKLKQQAVADALKDERLESRLTAIEEKLDIHNGYAEKFSNLDIRLTGIATSIAVIENDIKTLYNKAG